MDALHEDLYFTTLMFFRLLGRNARGEELTYPGRVLPVMIPKSDGKPGRARTRFTGFRTSRPAVVVEYEEAGGARGKLRLDVPRIEMDRPRAMAATVRAGSPGLARLEAWVRVNGDRDEREELLRREREEDVDDTILSAEQAIETIEILNGLKASYESHHGVTYPPETIEAAVTLSTRHLKDLHLPDKAIDVIDEAGAAKKLQPEAAGNQEPGTRNQRLTSPPPP